jgi:hypothetical protein
MHTPPFLTIPDPQPWSLPTIPPGVPKATLRQRKKRRLDAAGQRPITIAPDYYALAEALIKSGRLTERECLNRAKVAAEATEIMNEWSRRWWDT